LSDICVDWGPDAEFYPEIIPDLYAGEPLWIVARLPLEPREITICGLLNGQPWEQTSRPQPAGGNDTLATLWARKKIEALEDGMMFGADVDFSLEQILDVAMEFGLLTAQTSLVAVDRTPVRMPDEALASGQIPGLLPAGTSASFASFPQTAAGWQLQLLLSALSLLIVCWLYWASAVPPGHPISRSPLGASSDAACSPPSNGAWRRWLPPPPFLSAMPCGFRSRPRPRKSCWSAPGSAAWPATRPPGPGPGRTPGRWPSLKPRGWASGSSCWKAPRAATWPLARPQ
jgi:hypothetical protein